MLQDEADSEPQGENQYQKPGDQSSTVSGDRSETVDRDGIPSGADVSTSTADDHTRRYWRWYRWVALLAGVGLVAAAIAIVINILLDDEDSDDDTEAWLSECEAILTFSASGGPHSVMICPGAADAYMNFNDLGKLIDEFLSMNMDADDEKSDLSTELFDDMEVPLEMAEKLFGLMDMFDLDDMLDEWNGESTDERKERGSDRKHLPKKFFEMPAPDMPIPDMPKGWWTPHIPRGRGDSDGWAYRKQCVESKPDRQSDTPEKCETWLWDGDSWKNADDDDENSQSWSGDGRFQFDDDGFKFFFGPNANGFDSLLDLIEPEEVEEISPEQAETSSLNQEEASSEELGDDMASDSESRTDSKTSVDAIGI